MAREIANFVLQTANAPGTAASVELLTTPAGRVSWLSQFSTGARVKYVIADGTQEEYGLGTVTSGSPDTLSRDTIVWNSAGTTTRLNFTGAVNVYSAPGAEDLVYLNKDGKVDLSLTATGDLTAEGGTVSVKSSTNAALSAENTAASGRIFQLVSDSSGNGFLYDATASAIRWIVNSAGRFTISGGDSYTASGAGLLDTSGAHTGYSGATTVGLVVTNAVVGYSFVATSDRDLKSDLTPITPEEGRRFVLTIDPMTFIKHVEADQSDAGSFGAGFIAQDLQSAGYDHMVSAVEDDRFAKGHRLSADYDQAVPYLLAALRGAYRQIDTLADRLAKLERSR